MTKLSTFTTLFLTAASATAFTAPSRQPLQTHNTQLNLFGSKNKDSTPQQGGQPGMMDQLAMFKKAQEIASKKNEIDKELAAENIVGEAADGKIKITVQYVPPQLPMNPTPGYEAKAVDIDEAYLNEVSSEELSAALVEAIRNGEKAAMERVAEKYKALEEDMKNIMGGMVAPPPQA
ncbi:hypothetical protein ACHAXN_006793 [Cyclotella atomus]|jgi:DNA-binding protein YbaB